MAAPQKVSDTELQILDVLWNSPAQTIRTVCESIYGDASTSHYATVQSLLERLEKKGWVTRDRSERRHLFSAVRDRSEFIGEQIQGIANAVCDGSVVALLGQLAHSGNFSKKERQELRRLIEGEES